MMQTAKHKEDKQITFNFAWGKTADYALKEAVKEVEKGEKKTIVCLFKKNAVEEKRIRNGGYHLQQILFNVDFRFGHDGLNVIAKQAGIDLSTLAQGNVIIFFNTSKTSMKVAFSDQDIFHHRQSTHIEQQMIPEIMKRLNATGRVEYPEALTDFLTKAVNRRSTHLN